ncbi:serine hydrolase [Streptomyces sp. FH025]|uniref:serine hydrolase domain-containing protein n=1 Tax=Streptomyces sp. FH025 TaxID=2815937 RepID=UPI001A9F5E93|nr:serine hydrolase domain-containing protein [Streptomyces sp. FH025]MBO1416422.1 beta-lactamase family protein [Streptomyces sp. FH025]
MRTTTRAAVTALLTGAVLAATVTTAAPVFADQAAGQAGQWDRHPGVQAVLDQGVTTGGLPGAVAEVRDGRHRWFGDAGVADITTGRPRQEQDRFRIGSTTKTFVSTVVLQLAAEGRLSLDDSVEHWLPGVLDASGYQPDRITVRQLLNHTSGVPNFAMDDEIGKEFWHEPFLQHRFDDFTPERLVGIARAHQPDFAPGTGWTYSDTNYVLAGMIVERASGSTLAQQIRQRITTPLGLTSTYEPASEDVTIHGPHGREYSHLGYTDPNTPDYDVTELSPSWGWASGDMISTTRDLNTFFAALLDGRLLPPAQQQEMFTMVRTPADKWIKDTSYGLGVSSVNLPCTTVWGMGGAINGSWTYTYGSRDGRHLLSTNVNGDWLNGGSGPIDLFTAELKAEFCPGS